jgi:F-type H+-transporting ATPase subunit b
MELVKPEFGLVFWMTVSFLIVVFILRKFAWGPILSSLKERETSIEDALNAAKKAKEIKIQECADASKIVAKECSKNQEFKKFRQACDEARGVMFNKCMDEEHEKDPEPKKRKKRTEEYEEEDEEE